MAARDEAEHYACALVLMHMAAFLRGKRNAGSEGRPWCVAHLNDMLVTSRGGAAKSYGLDAKVFEAPPSDPPPNLKLRDLHIAALIVNLTSEPHCYSPNDFLPSTEHYVLARRAGALVAWRDARIRNLHLREHGGKTTLPTPSAFHAVDGDSRLAMAEFQAIEDAAAWGFPDLPVFAERRSEAFLTAMARRSLDSVEAQYAFFQTLAHAYWDDIVALDLLLEGPFAADSKSRYRGNWPFHEFGPPAQPESRS